MFPLYDSIRTAKTPIITWLLMLANIWLFWLELQGGQKFLGTYALTPAHINQLDWRTWYPFITAMFLHGGWFHLFANMWFLRIFGDNVEAAFGRLRFLLFYLVAGVIAGFVQYIVAPHSSIPMLGASGAIAGVLGAYLVLFPQARITSFVFIIVYITVIDIPAWFYLPYWFLLQLFSGIGQINAGTLATSGGVAFLAHAAGFIVGFLSANLLPKRRYDP